MKRKNKLPVFALSLATAFAFFGCGDSGGGDGGGGSAGGGGGDNTAPVANAGESVEVSSGFNVSLDGSGSSDADGDSLTYTWTQTKGPDVTGGTGSLSGVDPSFTAPDSVDTLVFELVVNDGTDDSPPSSVAVNVFEDLNVTYFVDGDNGDDETGNGSRENPFASIGKAVSELTTNLEDIYVRTRVGGEPYDETATDLEIPGGTSLYGGYDSGWARDPQGNKTLVQTNHRGVQFFSVTQDAWFSGFDLRTNDSTDATEDVFGVSGSGDGTFGLFVENNTITTGDVEAGQDSSPGSNYGVALRFLAAARVADNVITVGSGGDGLDGSDGDDGNPGDDGENGNRTGGNRAAGGNTGPGGNGGAGGARGGLTVGGGNGGNGGPGTAPLGGTIAGGTGGDGGNGGKGGGGGNTGGRGVPGAAGTGAGVLTSSLFVTSSGVTGSQGGHGSGGGGGGGGDANSVGVVGGGGGGGGEGGQGGFGGRPGIGGGASIGVWLTGVDDAQLAGNTITAGLGGTGGRDGVGGPGGAGGTPGTGAAGDDQGILGNGAGGGGGGGGGDGGRGGYGGAGGGGPSYGVVFGAGMAPTLTGNTITSGDGGAGGVSFQRGNGGQGGFSFAVYDGDPTDAFFATLNQNTLGAGAPGLGGEGGGLDTAEPGTDGESGSRNWQ
jgi:hypothetical protein